MKEILYKLVHFALLPARTQMLAASQLMGGNLLSCFSSPAQNHCKCWQLGMTWSVAMLGGQVDICESSTTSITQPAKPCQTSSACHLLFGPLPAAPFEASKLLFLIVKGYLCLARRNVRLCIVQSTIKYVFQFDLLLSVYFALSWQHFLLWILLMSLQFLFLH